MAKKKEQRSNERNQCDLHIKFTIEENPTAVAQIVDISATGMGISTTTKLQKGQIVYFLKDQPKWELPERALVVWCFAHKTNHRAGLEFVEPNK